MNTLRKYVLLLMGVIAFAACSDDQKGTIQVSGKLLNTENLATKFPGSVVNDSITLVLYEVPFGNDKQPIQLDSVTIPVKKGSFSLKGTTSTTESMYDIAIPNGPLVPLVNDASAITVDFDFTDNKKFYSVSGSEASGQLRDFIFAYDAKSVELNSTMAALDSMKRMGSTDSALISATNAKNKAIGSLNNFLKDFMAKASHPVVATLILGRAAETLPQNDFDVVLTDLVKKFPADNGLTELKKRRDVYKLQAAEQEKQRAESSWVGKKAPDLVMPDVNGKNISIASFKGKYVLVDFWASWCGPCRQENPNVVAAYQQFKNKNFTVLGVSLDMKKENWLQAIQQDGLNWAHMSDLAYWKSKAVSTFNFDGIPFNVLLDPDGNVIGEGLRGEDLTNKLSEVLH